jgi:hypothetical protein
VTTLADRLSDCDRERLAGYLARLRGVDRELRQPGTLATPPDPVPLHRPVPDHGAATRADLPSMTVAFSAAIHDSPAGNQ